MLGSDQADYENRIRQLTESLIQKQTMIESLETEKRALTLQLERTEVRAEKQILGIA